MSALPNLEALALRWCDRAERAEVTRLDERHLQVVVIGDRVRPGDVDRLASIMGYRLAPLGVEVDVEARTLELPAPVGGGLGRRGPAPKLDGEVLAALAEAPLTRQQLAYKLKIGPRSPRQQRLSNSLYRLEHVERTVEQRRRRYALVNVPVPS